MEAGALQLRTCLRNSSSRIFHTHRTQKPTSLVGLLIGTTSLAIIDLRTLHKLPVQVLQEVVQLAGEEDVMVNQPSEVELRAHSHTFMWRTNLAFHSSTTKQALSVEGVLCPVEEVALVEGQATIPEARVKEAVERSVQVGESNAVPEGVGGTGRK